MLSNPSTGAAFNRDHAIGGLRAFEDTLAISRALEPQVQVQIQATSTEGVVVVGHGRGDDGMQVHAKLCEHPQPSMLACAILGIVIKCQLPATSSSSLRGAQHFNICWGLLKATGIRW
jgi:hypothetical protein